MKAHDSPEGQRDAAVSVPTSQEKRLRLRENPCRARPSPKAPWGHEGHGGQ